MAKRIHIIIAEPSAIIRCGVVTLLERVQNLNLDIAEISDLTTLSTSTHRQIADLLIVNPSHLGLFSPSEIRATVGNDNLKIIALQSVFIEQSLLQNYDDVVSIFDSIETIAEKISQAAKSDDEAENRKELSQRERQIIVCVVKGMTNKQIAETLFLSTHTVIAHRRNIANKLQIHSPSGLTIYAIVNKLVNLADIKSTITQSREEQ